VTLAWAALLTEDSTVTSGSLLLAIPIATAAGLVSFLSPCVLPLVPAYLSYVTGLTGLDLDQPRRGRMLAGTLLFVLGFTAVFVSYGALFGELGSWLLEYSRQLEVVLGLLTIAMGLAFVGILPGFNRDVRVHAVPVVGWVGAPLLGVLFGLGWTPCIGPTLASVQALAVTEASAARGALLTAFYCLGLGLPFILIAVGVRRAAGAIDWVKQHYALIMRIGGGMLVLLGLLLVTGLWGELAVQMRTWISGFTPAL
jgi:cytochrome c-type biogenesis protein